MAERLELQFRRVSNVLDAEVGDELVALDVSAGECFGFNQVARMVWQLLAETKSFSQLRDALLAEYDVGEEQCTTELQELLDDLAAKGLIISVAE